MRAFQRRLVMLLVTVIGTPPSVATLVLEGLSMPPPSRACPLGLGRSSSSNRRRKPGAHHAGPPSSLLPAPAPLPPQVLGLQAPVPSLPVDDLATQDTLPSLLPPVHGGLSGDGNGGLTVQLGACSQPPTLSDCCTTAGCTGGPLATAVAPKLACTLVQPSASVSSALLPPMSAFSSRLHRGWSIAVMMLMFGRWKCEPRLLPLQRLLRDGQGWRRD